MLAQNRLDSRSVIIPNRIAKSAQSSCRLIWRGRKLLVRSTSKMESLTVNILQDSDRLLECLRRSPIERVKLDPALGASVLLWWADACNKANKVCYLSQLPISKSIKTKNVWLSWIQKELHRMLAILGMILLSPIFIFLFLSVSSPLRKQWAVMSRGQLLAVWLPTDTEKPSFLVIFLTRLINTMQGNMLLTDALPLSLISNF
jgi:hypothetical protein